MLLRLNNNDKTEIKRIKQTTLQGINWNEKDLENLISNNIAQLIPENQLMILFQEYPLNECADIYALDKKGILYIFELKRWEGNQENLLQILRYGQIHGIYSYEQLQEMHRKYKKDPELDLASSHYEYFKEQIAEKLKHDEFNKDQQFIVITNGIDLETHNAINYWKSKGLKIESIVYRVYSIDGIEPILEFNPYNPENEMIMEEEEGYFIVNTNITWSNTNYKEMLNEEKAAAYYDRKLGIKNIKKGNIVFLYHTGVGVVAYGKAIDSYKKKDVDGDNDQEFYIKLKFDWKIDPIKENDKAVRAWEINNKLKSGYCFRQTVFSINEEMKNAIIELAKNK